MMNTSELVPTADTLAGRVVLVTGANGGLGEAVVHACAAAGAQVVLMGRRLPKLTRLYDALVAAGAPTPALYPMDLAGATPDDHADMAQALEREFGRLDGIVHGAAEFKGLVSLENLPLEDWFTGLHVNLTAPFLLTRACLPLLRKSPDARVLFPLDDDQYGRRAFWGSYGIAKQAQRSLIATLRNELANSTVRVHGVQPGPMRTALRARAWFGEDPAALPLPQAYAPAIACLLGAAGSNLDEDIVRLRANRPSSAPRALGLPTLSG